MQILTHRGLWTTPQEQNTYSSIIEALQLGYGVELDVRDYNQEIAISHDMPNSSNTIVLLREVFDFYKNLNYSPLLAFNLKSDGIKDKLKSLIKSYNIENYLIFDGSFPEIYRYAKDGLKVFVRQSEYELPAYCPAAKGIWLDSFDSDWFSAKLILDHLQNGMQVAIVSPELHSRDYRECWQLIGALLQEIDSNLHSKIILCTDHPVLAAKYFNLPYIKALICDMDGVLIEAKEWHYESLNKALSVFDQEITRLEHETVLDGLPTKTKLQFLAEQNRINQQDFKAIEDLKHKYLIEIAKATCTPTSQHIYMLDRLKRLGFSLVVCSNSIRPTVDLFLTLAKVKNYFNFTLSNQDVTNPKPDPEIYDIAISKLELRPLECLIVEDNFNGIRAAQQSGACVFIINTIDDLNYQSVLNEIQKTRSII